MNELIVFYEGVLQYPLANTESEYSLGIVKEIAIRTYNPQLTEELRKSRSTSQSESNKQQQNGYNVDIPAQQEEFPDDVDLHKELDSLISGMADQQISDTIGSPSKEEEDEKVSMPSVITYSLQATRRYSSDYQYVSKLALDPNDKKYSSRWLYLFNDSLSLSTHEFALDTTWIESLSKEFKGGKAFRLISPEKRLIVTADDLQEKEQFLSMVQAQIINTLKKTNSLLDPEGKRRIATSTFSSGAYYEGEWENGVFDGKGTHLSADGDKYTGEWVKGLRQGKGTLLSRDGSRYEGEWIDNQVSKKL